MSPSMGKCVGMHTSRIQGRVGIFHTSNPTPTPTHNS